MKLALRLSILVHIVTLVAVTYALVEKAEFRHENMALKAEKLLWQSAAMTAIRARGWVMSTTTPEDLTPEHLRYALNPCYTTKTGNFEQHNRDCIAVSMTSSPVGVPIKIELANSWP